MSNYNSLKATINANVKTNGNQEITGSVMNSVLNAMVNSLGAGYQFMGMAVPATSPGTPDSKVFYLATKPGTYTNFNGEVVAEGEVAIFRWDSSWHKDVTGCATSEIVAKIGDTILGIDRQGSVSFSGGSISSRQVISGIYIPAGKTFKFKATSNNSWTRLGFYSQRGWGDPTGDSHDQVQNGVEYTWIANSDITEVWLFMFDTSFSGSVTAQIEVDGLIDSIVVGTDRIEDGAVTTPKLASNAVTEEKLASNAVSTSKIKDDSITIDKIQFKTIIEGENRADPAACVHGYIDKSNGNLVTGITTRYATDFIRVSENGLYCNRPNGYGIVGGGAVYDENKQYLRGFAGNVNVYTYQAGDGFVRWTVAVDAVETPSLYVIEGTSPGQYTPYVAPKQFINRENIPELGTENLENGSVTTEKLAPGVSFPSVQPAISLCGKAAVKIVASSIAAGGNLQITDFPQYLKGNGIVSFSGKLTSFDEIFVGFGMGEANSIQVKVDSTYVTIIESGSQTWQNFKWEHGLTISDFIDITYDNDFLNPKVVVATKSGLFVQPINEYPSLESYGYPSVVLGANTQVSNADLRATSDKFNKPIWVIGDSFTSMYQERWTYQMVKSIGVDKFLIDGLAGGGSAGLRADLDKALVFGTPKFLLWCLGMNDGYSGWLANFNSLKAVCDEKGIELVLQTIPIPNLSTSDNQVQINNAVRASGLRYIDAAAAMSPNSSYPWYDGYNADGVHPTTLGARVLAARFLSDFPEFMQ